MNELKPDHPFADLLPGELPLLPCGEIKAELEGAGTEAVVFLEIKRLPLQRICDLAERFARIQQADPLAVIVEIIRTGLPIRSSSFRTPPVIVIDHRLVS